jgi:D-serine deaminase-like pyridoxal phosphate-dependent protein
VSDLARTAANRQTQVGVLADVDVGLHRCGVPPGDPAACLARAAIENGLRFRGLMGYEGHAMRKLPGHEKEQAVAEAMGSLVATAELLRQEGVPVEIVSCGGTGTYSISGRFPGVSEIQAGSYLLMDTDYQKCCTDFGLSLSVLATVVSKTAGERIVVDAGLKSLSCERGLPTVKDMPGLSIRRLTAEHGIIDLKDPAAPVELGDKVKIWVHYSDATVNLHDRMWGIRNGLVDEIIRVEG